LAEIITLDVNNIDVNATDEVAFEEIQDLWSRTFTIPITSGLYDQSDALPDPPRSRRH
jgi:hypothetical protein